MRRVALLLTMRDDDNLIRTYNDDYHVPCKRLAATRRTPPPALPSQAALDRRPPLPPRARPAPATPWQYIPKIKGARAESP
eukprot:253233-Prorocentrum_minimum.AAC.8